MKVVGLVSGGKDSCFNMMKCVADGHEIVCLANLYPSNRGADEIDSYMYQSVAYKGVEVSHSILLIAFWCLQSTIWETGFIQFCVVLFVVHSEHWLEIREGFSLRKHMGEGIWQIVSAASICRKWWEFCRRIFKRDAVSKGWQKGEKNLHGEGRFILFLALYIVRLSTFLFGFLPLLSINFRSDCSYAKWVKLLHFNKFFANLHEKVSNVCPTATSKTIRIRTKNQLLKPNSMRLTAMKPNSMRLVTFYASIGTKCCEETCNASRRNTKNRRGATAICCTYYFAGYFIDELLPFIVPFAEPNLFWIIPILYYFYNTFPFRKHWYIFFHCICLSYIEA